MPWRRYFINLFIAVSQGLNAILGGAPDMTLCCRIEISRRNGTALWTRWNWLIWFITKLDPKPDHLGRAWRADKDEGDMQLVED